MRHDSCDLCGRDISERRFVVQIELFSTGPDDDRSDDDLNSVNLNELSDILAGMDTTGELNLQPDRPAHWRYDLCEECHGELQKDPLARHRHSMVRFSNN